MNTKHIFNHLKFAAIRYKKKENYKTEKHIDGIFLPSYIKFVQYTNFNTIKFKNNNIE